MKKFYRWLFCCLPDAFLLQAVHQAAARVQCAKDPGSFRDTITEIAHQMRTTSVADLIFGLEENPKSKLHLKNYKATTQAADTR